MAYFQVLSKSSFTFNISVNHLVLVQVGHALENLPGVADYNLFIKRTIFFQKISDGPT